MYTLSGGEQTSLQPYGSVCQSDGTKLEEIPMQYASNEMNNRRYSLPKDLTVDNPFSKREMWIFVTVYSICVVFLVCMYEYLMPVFNNPTYPYYNYVPNYSFKQPSKTQ
ncbi:unnamed protein product [Cylicocyclus nassatus]|uniref:Uncharacterized protein n=1 Tax=Cylicocyclus nassatus TaxID=53992 RepID=A0AA36HF73_CYLNA|nr:unnamed protein product [Cylicocyclus nassatus]